jgi:hypothetical protein
MRLVIGSGLFLVQSGEIRLARGYIVGAHSFAADPCDHGIEGVTHLLIA